MLSFKPPSDPLKKAASHSNKSVITIDATGFGRSCRATFLSHAFSAQTLMINLLIVLVGIVVIRSHTFVSFVEPYALALVEATKAEQDFLVQIPLEPLCWLNWFLHFLPQQMNLPILAYFYDAMKKKEPPSSSSHQMLGFINGKRVARALFVFHLTTQVHGYIALFNHCVIGYNEALFSATRYVFSLMVASGVIGVGLAILFGPMAFLVVASLIASQVVTAWKSPTASSLLTLSVVMIYLCTKEQVLPRGYLAAWVLMAIFPFVVRTSTDVNHVFGVVVLNAVTVIMAVSLSWHHPKSIMSKKR